MCLLYIYTYRGNFYINIALNISTTAKLGVRLSLLITRSYA